MPISAIKTNSAIDGDCDPKNTNDHNVLKIKFNTYKMYARVLLTWERVVSVVIMKNSDNPNRKYNIVHATENTHPGGVSIEWYNVLYHKLPPDSIGATIIPKIPGKNPTNIANRNFNIFIWLPHLLKIYLKFIQTNYNKTNRPCPQEEKPLVAT